METEKEIKNEPEIIIEPEKVKKEVKRDAKGRIAKGSAALCQAGDRAREYTRRREFTYAFLKEIKKEDMRLIAKVLIDKSISGDIKATKILLEYCMARPEQNLVLSREEDHIPTGEQLTALLEDRVKELTDDKAPQDQPKDLIAYLKQELAAGRITTEQFLQWEKRE